MPNILVIDEKEDNLLAARVKQDEDSLRTHQELLEQTVEERTKLLKESQEQYRKLVETSPDGVCQVGMDGCLSYGSPKLMEIFGVRDENRVIGSHVLDWMDPEDHEKAIANMNQVFEGGKSPQIAYLFVREDGTKFWGEVNSALLTDSEGKASGIIAIIRDISDRRLIEEILRESEARYRRITEAMTDYLYRVEVENGEPRVTRHGPGCLGVTGYTEEEFFDDQFLWTRIVVEEDLFVVRRQVGQILKREGAMPIEHRIIRKDGAQRWVRNTPVPRYDPEGRLQSYDGLIRDITERKIAEEEIKKQKIFFEQLFAQSSISTQILDKDGWCERINPKLSQIFGVRPEHIEGKVYNIFKDEGIRKGGVLAYLEKVFKEKQTAEWEVYFDIGLASESQNIQVQEKKKVWYHNWAYPIIDEKGELRNVIIQHTDISDRKKAEEEIKRLNAGLEQRVSDRTAELEALNKELEGFSYSISHDLRAPLRHLTGFANLLARQMGENLDEKSRNYLKVISDSAVKMGKLLDDVLSFSRMGRVDILQSRLNPNILVQELIKGIQSETRGREIIWSVAPLPEVYGDPTMLKIVFENLIFNAVKYTRGKPRAEIQVGHLAGQGNEEIFYVRDNGAGFDMQYKKKLFNLFQRLHHEDEFEGTGLGLANVRRIIQRHGGRVRAEGAVDQGATFYFSLPKKNRPEIEV